MYIGKRLPCAFHKQTQSGVANGKCETSVFLCEPETFWLFRLRDRDFSQGSDVVPLISNDALRMMPVSLAKDTTVDTASQHRKVRREPAIRDAQKLAQNVFPPWSRLPRRCLLMVFIVLCGSGLTKQEDFVIIGKKSFLMQNVLVNSVVEIEW